ncbi:hypothetical protein BN946_scf184573.g2 [Trametes cinnabarina]|uniref:Uncharacterized protein n=1 Tax=Pycnoporus cinnabarinus TaxID=5643 RepID=A0A060SE29_PYCCI|nr:hypothetical protein BN946_scf184573.g2 [Trametes cinnabarina]
MQDFDPLLILYDGAVLKSITMAQAYLRSVTRAARPHAVRLDVGKVTSLIQPFKSAFPKLTNLEHLVLMADPAELFDALQTTPPYLRILKVGGRNYPPCFNDILSEQSHLKGLSIKFLPSLERPRTAAVPCMFRRSLLARCYRA